MAITVGTADPRPTVVTRSPGAGHPVGRARVRHGEEREKALRGALMALNPQG
ncbi:hypothetical protein [Nocardia sp. NRRL S-836]|uniref:hypothetical protein n=1 Tax=Nocardia sp. NRRL S-836 TaxID=1519492 RepID=UPI000ACF705C|nr:hypothetical protein [Nocardia sp. NRRL S-836]